MDEVSNNATDAVGINHLILNLKDIDTSIVLNKQNWINGTGTKPASQKQCGLDLHRELKVQTGKKINIMDKGIEEDIDTSNYISIHSAHAMLYYGHDLHFV